MCQIHCVHYINDKYGLYGHLFADFVNRTTVEVKHTMCDTSATVPLMAYIVRHYYRLECAHSTSIELLKNKRHQYCVKAASMRTALIVRWYRCRPFHMVHIGR